jgi:hypothetical protein
MDNNKNRIKDREKSNAELRKIDPKNNADLGMIHGQVIGVHEGKHEKGRTNVKAGKDHND